MNRVAGQGARRGIGWSAVLLLHALVLMAAFSAGAPSLPHRALVSEAPRSVVVLLRAALPSTAMRRQNAEPPAPLLTASTAKRFVPVGTPPQAAQHAPPTEAANAPAGPAVASDAVSVPPVVGIAALTEPTASPLPAAPSFARPDHAQCPHANYPMPLRERGIEGTVLLRVRVDAEGRSADVHLLQASGWRLFDEAALQAVRACRFIPARRDGAALASWVEFPVRFALAG